MIEPGSNHFSMSGSKHILFLTHYFPPEVNAPASRTYEHARRWVKRGARVTVITNHPNHPRGKLFPGYRNRFISREKIDGINVIRVKTFLTPNEGFCRRTVNYLLYAFMAYRASLLVRDFDVIIATTPQFFCGLSGVLVRKMKGKTFILEVRDLWPDSLIALEVINNGASIRLLRRLEKWMYFTADKIITTSDEQRYHIIKTGYPAQKVLTIANSVDLDVFHVEKHRDNKDNLFNDKFIICYAGTFGMAQGLDVILDTAELMSDERDIHFLLIGDGAERGKIVRRAGELKLPNLTIIPLQLKGGITRYIARSNIGLVTLKNHPLFQTVVPSKIFEYAALKKPVILATGKGEGANIVEKHDCGLVIDPEDSTKLKEAILKLYSDSSLRKRLGGNGFRAVKQHFNRDIMADRMLKVIFNRL